MDHSFPNPNQIPNLEQTPFAPQYFQRPQRQARNNIPSYNEDVEYEPEEEYIAAPPPLPPASMLTPGPRSKASSSAAPPPSYRDPNPLNIEIKTKFPVARIKRIMQADEEVGKVAQVTPVAVSKALELFMIALVGGAADKAREKGGKKVTSQHLKAVVMGAPEQFDFLAEIVARVGEAQEGAGGEGRKRKEAKDGSESSEEEKKVKKSRGRKKKSDD
ncbi:histone-fold-containing protein [Diplocarpon rosae]|nr:histone-fold-containing protein [Diplocarpon rosae]